MADSSRQVAFLALRAIQKGAFADVALDRLLRQTQLSKLDRRLATELIYGTVRRQRTLDALINQLATKKANQQPPDLRLILHLGLYQLRYLDQIPDSAAVDTTVELAKQNGLKGLAGFVNGLMRHYIRRSASGEVLPLPDDPVSRLGIQYSYPDWIVQVWLDQLGFEAAEKLCDWLNQPPHIDLRVNILQTSIAQVESAFEAAGIKVKRIPHLPQGLRLTQSIGSIQDLPGFEQGWWTVQDASAQLVSHLVDPQPGEIIIDACAAPGGKTTHLAELMADNGKIWACDRTASRLKKLQQNAERLHLKSIQIGVGDSREFEQFTNQADRVLLDAPCSGLGTLNRHADARWRQTPDSVKELVQLQQELIQHTATWVKPSGTLVYATCTLHPAENEAIVQSFLAKNLDWRIVPPDAIHDAAPFATSEGWIKVLPYEHHMDGFFMVRLQRRG